MTLDDLIRQSLKKAAEDVEMTDKQKTELLVRTLTVYLTRKLKEDESGDCVI